MKYGSLPGLRKRVSRLLLGTAAIALGNRRQVHALLDAAFALGCNAFNTARVYCNGESVVRRTTHT